MWWECFELYLIGSRASGAVLLNSLHTYCKYVLDFSNVTDQGNDQWGKHVGTMAFPMLRSWKPSLVRFSRRRASQINRIRRDTPWSKINKSPNFSPAAFESEDLRRFSRFFRCRYYRASPQAPPLRRGSLFELPGNGFKRTSSHRHSPNFKITKITASNERRQASNLSLYGLCGHHGRPALSQRTRQGVLLRPRPRRPRRGRSLEDHDGRPVVSDVVGIQHDPSERRGLRGRDFAFKKNALADNNTTQSLRSKLAVLTDLAKEKRKKA